MELMFYIDLLGWMASHPILSVIALLAQFFLVMKLHHSYHTKWLPRIPGLWFLPRDFVVNVVAMSVLGLDPPRELTVTARLQRWKMLPSDTMLDRWRIRIAWEACAIINKADIGHC